MGCRFRIAASGRMMVERAWPARSSRPATERRIAAWASRQGSEHLKGSFDGSLQAL